MKIQEIKKDLFTVDKKYALCQCISLDCAIGAGIAKQFRDKFSDLKSYLIRTKKEKDLHVPSVIYYESKIYDRKIFNLITKERYWNKPTYKSLEYTLIHLRRMCLEQKIEHIAMPYIGCGLDRLNWYDVLPIIKKIFQDTNIEILVCYK